MTSPPAAAAAVDALLDDVRLGAADESENLGAFRRRDLEDGEAGLDMAKKNLPVALVDPHSLVRNLHVAAGVVERPARRGAQKIDQQLFFTPHAVQAAVFPETAELVIRRQPGQQIVGDGRDRVVSAEALVKTVRHAPSSPKN